MKLIIEDDEGRKTVVPLVREEITIGRQDGNTIRLTERNVSRRHARLVKDNGSLLIEDLGSYNGVRVNGEKISGPTKIKEGDLVEIGDYDLGIQGKLEATPAGPPTPAQVKQATVPTPAAAKPTPPAAKPVAPPPVAAAPPPPAPVAAPPAPTPAPQPTQSMQSAMPSGAGGATAIIRVSDIMKSAPQAEVRDLERSEMPRLVGLAGPFRAKEFYLMRSEVKFGRTDENDVVVDHQSVSRSHCKFVLEQGQWKVLDNKSANGVRVNGEEYAVSNIKPGDTIEVGHLKFRFCAPGEKFTPPPEKVEEGAAAKGALKPTTAELIAGASQPGRSTAGNAPAAAKKKGPPVALIGGIAAGVVVLALVAVFAMRSGKKDDGGDDGDKGGVSGEAAVKQGDAAFKKHEYAKAGDFYDKASGTATPNKKRAADEAKGEEVHGELDSALAAGEFDKAKALYEKCSTETTYWCTKAQEKGDAVKAGYAKKHLEKANAAKASGKPDVCSSEVALVLGFDSANAEAQGVQCSPQAAADPVAKKEGPSPADRNAKAGKLAKDALEKVRTRDFDGAIAKAQAAMKENPADKAIQGQIYQAMGYAYANKGDRANAGKWLEKYLPFCSADCATVKQFIGK